MNRERDCFAYDIICKNSYMLAQIYTHILKIWENNETKKISLGTPTLVLPWYLVLIIWDRLKYKAAIEIYLKDITANMIRQVPSSWRTILLWVSINE